PNALTGSSARIAWPAVAEVVNRSPTSIGPSSAVALQNVRPTSASRAVEAEVSVPSRTTPALNVPAPETTPATRLSYGSELGRTCPASSITITVPGSGHTAGSTSNSSATSPAPTRRMSPDTSTSRATRIVPVKSTSPVIDPVTSTLPTNLPASPEPTDSPSTATPV